jgi:hypothetical protein
MNPSSWAGVITAVATVVTAIGGLVLAVAVLIPNLRASREAIAKVDQVHTIVNQQRTDAQRYQVALVRALRKAGVEVPDDQSLTEAQPPAPPQA